MLPIAWYLLKVIICSGILLGYYWLFLRNKIFHRYNRFYLLAAIVLSLGLPLIQINIWNKAEKPNNEVIQLLQVVSSSDDYVQHISATPPRHQNWDPTVLLAISYLLISCIFFIVFLHVLLTIRGLLKKYHRQLVDNIYFVNTDARGTPFSFLHYIFWNDKIDIESTTGNQVFRHEVAHVQERHSYDKLFMNVVMIVCWINPFFWLIRKELNMIHEFIADKKAVEDSDTAAFAAMILQATYPQHRFQLTNNFFYSPIKRRLLMLVKNKNPKASYIGRVLVLPLAVLVFAAFTFKAKTTYTQIYHGKQITVVIDAGHGGEDAGAKSVDGKTSEKDLNLAIIKKIKELNTNDKIHIILTRENDLYQSPADKANFAKQQNPDLFISFHVDNGPKDSANIYTGMSVWVAKDEYGNSGKSKVLASSIINAFSNNYGLSVLPKPNQREKGIWVLQNSTCPAVLIETGFINNEKDLHYLQTTAAKETIAKNILAAIENYAVSREQTNELPTSIIDTVTPKKDVSGVNAASSLVTYNNAVGNKEAVDVTITATAVSIKNSPNNVLYILNGKESEKVVIDKINPNDIQDVRVIKNSDALKVYGEKGKNGVIIVNTKPGFAIINRWKADTIRTDGKKGGPNPIMIVDNKEYYPGKTLDEIAIITGQKQYASVDIYGSEEAIKLFGESGKDGAVVVVTKKPIDTKFTVDAKVNVTPRIYIGEIAKSRVSAELFKRQKEIRVTPGYSFVETDIYFSGAGFKYVETAHLRNSSLKPIENILERCEAGTAVTFDNIYVKDADGKLKEIEGQAYSLYDIYKKNSTENKIFSTVEQEPKFPGTEDGWNKYLMKNLDASTPVKEGWKPGMYTVILQYIVHTDGSITDIATTNYKGSKTAQHCIDLIKKGPKWEPALQNGKPVTAYKRQPITFVVEEEQTKSGPTVYRIPLKVHMMNDGQLKTYDMVGNGTFNAKTGKLILLNGKPYSQDEKINAGQQNISPSAITSMESYDEESGKKYFGEKGKNGVLLLSTKS